MCVFFMVRTIVICDIEKDLIYVKTVITNHMCFLLIMQILKIKVRDITTTSK